VGPRNCLARGDDERVGPVAERPSEHEVPPTREIHVAAFPLEHQSATGCLTGQSRGLLTHGAVVADRMRLHDFCANRIAY
jgi:hypothetical protein